MCKPWAACVFVDGAHLCAWTTTPWTLPSNLALCVNADFEYVKVNRGRGCREARGGSGCGACKGLVGTLLKLRR